MIHVMDGDQNRFVRNRRAHCFGIKPPLLIHFDAGAREPVLLQKLNGVNHGRMLHRANNDVTALALAGIGRAFDRKVRGFCAVRSENDVVG